MWNDIKDYMNAFLGIVALILPFLFIPEIRKSWKYKLFVFICTIILFWLGYDKINRDKTKDSVSEKRNVEDSTKISNISNNYAKDTSRFSDFKKELESKYHIFDSANKPVQINNYKINTHIDKAETVNIGPPY